MDNAMNNGEANLSVYGEAGQAEDFPVLKAFQQYIDAEQAKARKRMIALSAVFGVITIILVIAFMFVVGYVNQQASKLADRNQQLNDRLVEYAMKQQERPSAAVDNGASALKAVTESLAQLQTQMIQQQQAALAAQKAAAAAKPASAETVAASDIEKIRRAAELLRAEKAKIAQEKERLRREEVERQRRRLYPEYYAREDARKALVDRDDVDALVDEVEDLKVDDGTDDLDAAKPAARKPSASKPSASKPSAAKPQDEILDDDDAIDYFNDDEFVIPVDAKDGRKSRFRIPLK